MNILPKVDTHAFLAAFAVVSSFVLIMFLCVYPIPEKNRDLVIQLTTMYVTGCAIGAYNFYFGSNKKQVDPNTQMTTITEEKTSAIKQ